MKWQLIKKSENWKAIVMFLKLQSTNKRFLSIIVSIWCQISSSKMGETFSEVEIFSVYQNYDWLCILICFDIKSNDKLILFLCLLLQVLSYCEGELSKYIILLFLQFLQLKLHLTMN